MKVFRGGGTWRVGEGFVAFKRKKQKEKKKREERGGRKRKGEE